MFLFSIDPYRILSFLCKTKPSCEIYLVLQECVFFRFKNFFFHKRWFVLWICRKKEIQFLFRLLLNAMKRLWGNVDTQMLLAFSSIMINLHSKFFFSIYSFVLCWLKVCSIIAITVSLHQRNIHIKLRDHQFVCRLHRLFSWVLSTR